MLLYSSAWLASCSGLPLKAGAAPPPLEFLVRIQTATAQEREFLWSQYGGIGGDPAAQLRRALLQSFPGHRGYSLAEAEAALQSLQSGRGATATVARVRLNEIHDGGECHAEVESLKQRLAKVADIERKTQSKER